MTVAGMVHDTGSYSPPGRGCQLLPAMRAERFSTSTIDSRQCRTLLNEAAAGGSHLGRGANRI